MFEVIKVIDGEKWSHGKYSTEDKAVEAVQEILKYYCVPTFIREVKK